MAVEVLCLSLVCYALLCVLPSFAIILKRKRERVAWLYCLTDVVLRLMFCCLPHGAVGAVNVLLSSSRCRGLVCGVLWRYFLIILSLICGV